MDVMKIVPIALILVGLLGVAYGTLGGRDRADDVDAGPVPIVTADQRVNVPMWVGLSSILMGGFLLIRSRKA